MIWLNRNVLAAIAVCGAGVTVVGLAHLQDVQSPDLILARIDEERRVIVMDPASGAEQVIYRSIADGADGLSISPGTGRLALFEMTQSREGPQPNYTSRLVVLDRRGAVVGTIGDDVRVFTWCGEDCVAYITGRYSEDVGFHARGVFVRSPLAGRSTEISGVPSPRRIVWAPFDSSLYVGSTRGTIFRSAVSGGPAVATPYKGMAFSPSGKYYLGRDEASDSIRLYETATNRWVPLPMLRTLGEPAGWVFEQGDYLLFGRRLSPRVVTPGEGIKRGPPGPAEYTIYDVNSRRVLRKLSGELGPWARPRGVLALVSGGRLEVIRKP